MKKSLVITGLTIGALSLMAIGFVREQEKEGELSIKTEASVSKVEETEMNEVEQVLAVDNFAIQVGTRFIATISKEELNKAASISEIIPKDANWNRYPILKTQVRIANHDLEMGVKGDNLNLNESQLALLKSVQYSDNLQFGAQHTSSMETGSLNYMVSVVPEKQAEYVNGKEALTSFLRDNSSALITMWSNNQWRDGKINFTIDKEGVISNIRLMSTSGNPTIDQHMVQLISKTQNDWVSAENAKGEKVEQVLTFSFGNLGC